MLDRAIQHDARALDAFEQNVGVWHHLQRTAQMNELERRSQFSTDLRVRQANADLNLAINGVSKTEATADQLPAGLQVPVGEPVHHGGGAEQVVGDRGADRPAGVGPEPG